MSERATGRKNICEVTLISARVVDATRQILLAAAVPADFVPIDVVGPVEVLVVDDGDLEALIDIIGSESTLFSA